MTKPIGKTIIDITEILSYLHFKMFSDFFSFFLNYVICLFSMQFLQSVLYAFK